MDHIDGRISVNEIGPESCDVYLYLTKPDDVLPIIEIDVHLVDTGLENNEIAIHIMGKLAEQEHDIPFADVLAKSILDDYQYLKPWVKEGIVHKFADRMNLAKLHQGI